jgi:hypothetical protein
MGEEGYTFVGVVFGMDWEGRWRWSIKLEKIVEFGLETGMLVEVHTSAGPLQWWTPGAQRDAGLMVVNKVESAS